MGGGFIGGDGSVKWQFQGESIRGGSIISNGAGVKGHRQEAIDESEPGASFVLTIDLPCEDNARKKFVEDLIEQLKGGRSPISIVAANRGRSARRSKPRSNPHRVAESSRQDWIRNGVADR